MLVGVKNSNRHVQSLCDDPWPLCEVGIVRYEHSNLVLLVESVSNEVSCKVDIRSLLFSFFDPNSLRRSDRCQIHRDGVSSQRTVIKVEAIYRDVDLSHESSWLKGPSGH